MILDDDARWLAWCVDFDEVEREVMTLFHTRWMWRTITDLMATVPSQYVTVQNYFLRTYVATVCLGIRREADRDARTTSMARCLQALIDHPHMATRTRFAALVADHVADKELLEGIVAEGFGLFSPSGGHAVDPATVQASLDRLKTAAAPVWRYTTKIPAHRERGGQVVAASVSFETINHALDELGEITKLFFRLRHPGQQLANLTPAVSLAFLDMFSVPWYQAGHEVRGAMEMG